jgi:peptide methionine sulfoxide reductase msrA/msrB
VRKLVKILAGKKIPVRTEINEAGTFWPAEEYHQDYYRKQGREPTCHRVKSLF